jgi:hypothetical protein
VIKEEMRGNVKAIVERLAKPRRGDAKNTNNN